MSQQYSAEEIESLMPKISECFRTVLAENGLDGVEVFGVELRARAEMETLLASAECVWKYVCKPTPHGWECRWECV